MQAGNFIRTVSGVLKGAMSRCFESFSVRFKITFNVKETKKYLFSQIDKHQNGKNKEKRNAYGLG